MINLFIDASRKSLSIAVTSEDKLIFKSNVESYSKHSNYLMNEIRNILEKTNIKISEIDNYIVLNGPGSFTGVRVGVTIAKTLAWSLNKKIFVLSNLNAIKVGLKDDVIISVIYDKDNTSFVGLYENNKIYEGYLDINDLKLDFKNKNITIAYMEENTFIDKLLEKLNKCNKIKKVKVDDYDYLNVVNTAISFGEVAVHGVKPVYLKKIDAEK